MDRDDIHPQGTNVCPTEVDDDQEPKTKFAIKATRKSFWVRNLNQPAFFKDLHIASDGGFSEVSKLFTWDRFMHAAVALIMVLVNFSFIIWPNVTSLVKEDWIVDKTNRLTILNRGILGWMEKELKAEVYIAFIELVMLVFLTAYAMFYVIKAVWLYRSDEMESWISSSHFFFTIVPELSSFSAMRLLNFVTPSIFIPRLNVEVSNIIARHGKLHGLPLVIFLTQRALAGIIGFDTFLVKFHATAKYTEPGANVWDAFMGCLAFVNQVLGIVQVSTFVRWRLLVYIFGGPDGYVNRKEHLGQKIWHAMLARRVWEEAQSHKFSFLWFCAVMLSYSDYDFQTLTLNDNSKKSQNENQVTPMNGVGAAMKTL